MVAVAAPGAPAQQMPPDWSQFQADGAHHGAAEGPEPPYAVAWELAVEPDGQQGLSAPVISEELGLVVAVGRTQVIGVDLASGRKLWAVERAAGPPASPAIVRLGDRDLLLYTEGGGGTGPPGAGATAQPDAGSGGAEARPSRLNAIDLATRAPAWKAPFKLDAASRSGVTVDGATAFVGDERGNVVAVDAATGKKLWTRPLQRSRPTLAVAQGRVVLTTAASGALQPDVVALSTTNGEEVWRTRTDVTGLPTSVPSLNGEAAVVGFADGSVRAFALSNGEPMWQSKRLYAAFSPVSAPAVAGGDVIAVDAAGGVRRLSGDSGVASWDFELNEATLRSSPVLTGMTVLLSLMDGTIAAIDGASGVLVWRSDASASAAGPLAVGSDVFVAVRGGNAAGLVAFRTDPQGSLVREQSPTVVRWPEVFGWWAIAAVVVGALLIVPARVALRSLGPSELDDVESRMGANAAEPSEADAAEPSEADDAEPSEDDDRP